MDTTRNRAAILATFLRAATADLRRLERRVDAEAQELRAGALDTIEAVAGELEEQVDALAPDPAGGAR
ncbi:MAG TPA: hypothetical protein VHB25_04295 [Gemmatimonadaceae bacterium]|nr:hypothetical protein [Gemmatimonadaceae bacterium]